jgi:hypothetical protein
MAFLKSVPKIEVIFIIKIMRHHFLSRTVFCRIMKSQSGLCPKYLTPDEQCKISVVLYKHNDPNSFTDKAIENASKFDKIDVLVYLHKIGIIDKYDCQYALRLAASNGCLNIIKYLIMYGKIADHTILNSAIIRGNINIMKYLIGIGIVPQSEAYIYIPCHSYADIIEILFHNNVPITSQTLEYLIVNNKYYIIELMNNYGFKMQSNTYIDLIVLCRKHNYHDAEQYLMRNSDILVK